MRYGSTPATALWMFSVICCALGGCGDSAPQSIPTYPATGTVLLPNGQPLAGGLIEFRSLDNTSVTTTSEIAEDGAFDLMTVLDDSRVAGAIAGEYRVTVIPPLGDTADVQAIGTMFSLPDTYQVTAEGANEFAITLPSSP